MKISTQRRKDAETQKNIRSPGLFAPLRLCAFAFKSSGEALGTAMRLAWAPATMALVAGCAVYDAPPEPTIEGLDQGKLADPTAPIVVSFGKPAVASTIKVEIAPYKTDDEGNLPDEVDAGGMLDPLFSHDPTDGDTGGTAELSQDRTTLTIKPDVVLPVGASLVLIVEPGLADDTGAVTHVRRRIVFGFSSNLKCNMPVAAFKSGTYFFLANVTEPIHVQVQLFGKLEVDPTTGATKGRFTKGRRNPDPSRCPSSLTCASNEVCRLLPSPACVVPSTPAGSVDEFSDYVPNPDPPTGFSFLVDGCAVDQSGTTSAYTTAKVDVAVQSPMVTLRNTQLSASFAPDGAGLLRGTGSLSADAVLLGTIDSGKGSGDLTARAIEGADVPPGIPGP
jgi:hypothetical protein